MSEYEQIKDYNPLMASEDGICIERHGVFEPAPEPQEQVMRCPRWGDCEYTDACDGYSRQTEGCPIFPACIPVDKEPTRSVQRRIAAQKGEPAPDFSQPAALASKERGDKMNKEQSDHLKYRREIARKHRQAHPEKKMARKAGEVLPKKPCVLCLYLNQTRNMVVEAHHDDYHQPWHVDWLCKTHHEQVDTAKDKAKEKGTVIICPICKEHSLHPDPCKDTYYCLKCKIEFSKKDLINKYKELASQ